MKLLYILNVANRVNNFSHTSMLAARELGIEFHIAGNWGYKSKDELAADEEKYGIRIHQIDFERSPLSLQNYKAYKQLIRLFKEWEFDAVHCNTPIGGLLGRIVSKKSNVSHVIYQAHGFHFYKGAPLLNWLIYYPVERILARLTDAIITINKEDYEIAQKFKLRKGGKVHYVPGVGIDTEQYKLNYDCTSEKRKELGLKDDDILVISIGELNKNKNNALIIEAIAQIKNPKIHYILCGIGELESELKLLANKLGVDKNIHFLGYRTDIKELLNASDMFVMPSFREGLSRSIMEAMSTGLPVVCSRIRGNTDLIDASNGMGGYLCPLNDGGKELTERIEILANDAYLRKKMGEESIKAVSVFSIDNVKEEMLKVYKNTFN